MDDRKTSDEEVKYFKTCECGWFWNSFWRNLSKPFLWGWTYSTCAAHAPCTPIYQANK